MYCRLGDSENEQIVSPKYYHGRKVYYIMLLGKFNLSRKMNCYFYELRRWIYSVVIKQAQCGMWGLKSSPGLKFFNIKILFCTPLLFTSGTITWQFQAVVYKLPPYKQSSTDNTKYALPPVV